MTSLISILLYLCILYKSILLNEDKYQKNCRERNRLIETEKGDLYMLIDATLGQNLTLQCHFCNENDDARPKIWYKIEDLGITTPHEVKLDMNNDHKTNKISVNSEHSLILNNFNFNDTGLYFCFTLEEKEVVEEKYNYLVDLIFNDNKTFAETGNFSLWRKYYEDYLGPVNQLFQYSGGTEFSYTRNELNLKMELITQWHPWGICDVCGRPKGEAIRKKIGFCRIKLSKIREGVNRTSPDIDKTFLLNANAISCRSQLLYRVFPGISNLTRIIPNFLQTQQCEGTCNPDAQGLAKGWKAKKSFGFKYRRRFVLNEGQHLIIVCPESTLENTVVWRKGMKVLQPGEAVEPPDENDEPRIIVDTFNTLFLLDVKESEAGNYSCQVDDTKMQQITVNVISKSRIVTKLFVRHLMYLGIVLLLTTSCYCAGVVIIFSRRSTFKGYQELKEIEDANEADKYYDEAVI